MKIKSYGAPVRSPDRFLVFGAPAIGEDEINEVIATLRSGWLGTGPRVARFQQDVQAYKDVRNAVAVNSCTAALHLSLIAAGIQPGDEVITTPLTFCATANAIIHAGATPVLADIDPITMNIDPAEVAEKIGPRTRGLLPVHFAGRSCNMDDLSPLVEQHGLFMVEDCAHAIETEYHGRKAGTFGDFGCLSFYVTKNVVTGEGGMIITNNDDHADRSRVLGLHGMSRDAWKRFGDEGFKHYQVIEAGFKYNMMDLQAAIGIHQLARVDANWKRREAIWNRYNEAFSDLPIGLPAAVEDNTRHAYHLYTILVDERRAGIPRDAFLDAMTYHGIGVGVHYLSLAEHPYYRETLGWKVEDYPHAMQVGRQTVSLPISAGMNDGDVDDVVESVNRVIRDHR